MSNTTSPDASSSNPPSEPKKRSTAFLRPDQLQRKREFDRENQKQVRARTKARLQYLENRVEELSHQLELSHMEVRTLQSQQISPRNSRGLENVGFRTANVQNHINGSEFNDATLYSSLESLSGAGIIQNLDMGLDASSWTELLSWTGFPDLTQDGSNTMPSTTTNFPPTPLYPSIGGSIPIWEALPRHHPPTCQLDKILVDLIRSKRACNVSGDNAVEFSNAQFPSVSSLLNPSEAMAKQSDVTSTVVSKIIYVHNQNVPELPEQLAIMVIICQLVRWQISPTEKNYDDLPDFMRPTGAQLVTDHPAWMDAFPWPKAREKMCRYPSFHNQLAKFKQVCNSTISINWPYDPSDALLAVSETEFILNPVFEKHIRRLSNWTVGPDFVDAFPSFANDVNIGPPRGTSR